jgi:hypothetical protein
MLSDHVLSDHVCMTCGNRYLVNAAKIAVRQTDPSPKHNPN